MELLPKYIERLLPPLYLDRILWGDCTHVLPTLPAACIDLVVTDPPYLVGYRDRGGRQVLGDRDAGLIERAFAEVGRVLKPGRFAVSFYGWNRADVFLRAWRSAGLWPVGHFVWVKDYASSVGVTRRHHEQAYLLAKGSPRTPQFALRDVLEWHYTGNHLHPTQKPEMALRPLILAYSRPGEIVLDPFVGSGTTAVAARLLGRHYIGMELDLGHIRTARARLGLDHPRSFRSPSNPPREEDEHGTAPQAR